MDNEDFSVQKAVYDEYRIAPDNLTTTLSEWKIVADQFYRGSEIIFISLQNDWARGPNDQTCCVPQNLDPIYFFLTGMCLENMIKGVLIHQNPNLVTGQELKGKIKSHDLKSLSTGIAGCQFTDSEMRLFEFLTVHIVWISKYPIPTHADNFFEGMHYQMSKVRKAFLSTYNKLSRIMEATGELPEHLHKYEFSPSQTNQ